MSVSSFSSNPSPLTTVDQAVASIATLSSAPNSEVAPLAEDLQALRDHGHLWSGTTRGTVAGALSGLMRWSGSSTGRFNELPGLARAIAQGDSGSVAPFNTLLGQLRDQLFAQANQLMAAQVPLRFFLSAVRSDSSNSARDDTWLKNVLQTWQQSVNDLNQQATTLRNDINRDELWMDGSGPLSDGYYRNQAEIARFKAQLNDVEQRLSQAGSNLRQASANSPVVEAYGRVMNTLGPASEALFQSWNALASLAGDLLQRMDVLKEDIQGMGGFGPQAVDQLLQAWRSFVDQVQQLSAGTGVA